MSEPMTLDRALFILAETHTREDDVAGFVVMHGAEYLHHRDADYIAAWKAVRAYLGLPVDDMHGREDKRKYQDALKP